MEMSQPAVMPNPLPGMQNPMEMSQPAVMPNPLPGMQNQSEGMPENSSESEIQNPFKTLPEIQVPTNEQEKKETTKNGLETIISNPSDSDPNPFNMFGGIKRKKFKSSNKMIEKFVNGFKRKTKKKNNKNNKNNKKQTKRKNNTKKHVSKKKKNTKKKK